MSAALELSVYEIQELCQRYLRHDDNRLDVRGDKANSFKIIDYALSPTSDAPAGFLGRHQFLNIKLLITDDEGNVEMKNLRFFTKSAPVDVASRMEYLEEFGVFKKEINVYREVIPKLEKIFIKFAPKCYYADNNFLIFENLIEQNYKMAAQRDGLLNYDHLNCILKVMAAMHASSIVHEQRLGKKLSQVYPTAIIENAYPLNVSDVQVRKQNFNNALRVYKEIIKTLPKYQKNLQSILQKFPKKMETIFELCQPSEEYQNVFLHGDFWANNIMFLYDSDDDNSTPVQCRFVDFQLARYASPLLDVVTVLTIPTSREYRKKHFKNLLWNYYGYMRDFLQMEDLNIDKLIPIKDFNASVRKYRICGLIESLLFSHLTILPPHLTQTLTTTADGFSDFFDRKRVEICMTAFHTDQMYRERLIDMTEDFIDNFVIGECEKNNN